MRSSVFLSDAALHYFLQSSLSIKEIEEKLEVFKKINKTDCR